MSLTKKSTRFWAYMYNFSNFILIESKQFVPYITENFKYNSHEELKNFKSIL